VGVGGWWVAVPLLCARAVSAQSGLWPADSLLADGRLMAAESVYYAAVRRHPRDPVARAALGRYLAARGGTRAGAVLLEEARFFGGDSMAMARSLIPLYARLGDYEALVSLRPNLLTTSERRRARWLATHATEARLRDSVVLVSYRPLGDGQGFGNVTLRLGRTELSAVIDPGVTGLVLPSGARRSVRTFGAAAAGKTLGVVDSLRVGPVTFSHVPAVVGSPDEPARIGFDVLAAYYPGFDPARGLMTLRRVNRRSPAPQGTRVPALYDSGGMRLLIAGKWHSTTASVAAMLLATRRWTWDWKLGEVVLTNP
jgi:hypothetical protein